MLEKGGNSQHESLVNIKSPIYRLLFTKCSYPSNPNILLTTLGLYPLTGAPLKSASRETKKEMAGRYQSKGGTILPTLISRPWLRNTNSRTSTTPWRDSNGAVQQYIYTVMYIWCVDFWQEFQTWGLELADGLNLTFPSLSRSPLCFPSFFALQGHLLYCQWRNKRDAVRQILLVCNKIFQCCRAILVRMEEVLSKTSCHILVEYASNPDVQSYAVIICGQS